LATRILISTTREAVAEPVVVVDATTAIDRLAILLDALISMPSVLKEEYLAGILTLDTNATILTASTAAMIHGGLGNPDPLNIHYVLLEMAKPKHAAITMED